MHIPDMELKPIYELKQNLNLLARHCISLGGKLALGKWISLLLSKIEKALPHS